MPGFISVKSLSVGEFLDGRRRLVLPWFQRSYAWGERQIGRLMTDILTAMGPQGRNRYFLGRIYLARPDGETADQLIDGNQRITTLTILFGLLRDMTTGEASERLARMIAAPDEMPGGQPARRLEPQPNIAGFLERYVQATGATRLDVDDDLTLLSHAERAILNNRELLKSRLSAMTGPECEALADFIRTRCCLTVSTVDDPEEAWDMLAAEEETGLHHHDADRAKHSILAHMPRGEQVEAARVWDTWSGRLGRDGIQELLSHVRMLGSRRRSTKPIEEDLIRFHRVDKAGLAFIDREFAPRARLLERIGKRDIGKGPARDRLSRFIDTLSWLDHTLWVPPLLRWLETQGEDHPKTVEFFSLIDRIAWLLKIAGVDPVVQERRFIEVCLSIGGDTELANVTALKPDRKLQDAAVQNLRSRTFEIKRYSDLVLRRVSLELGRDPGPLDPEAVTIEHVLPRNPAPGSVWWRHFKSAEQVADLANRLGNLAFLSRADNQLASAKIYEEKRRILAGSEFVLARDAAEHPAWTPETIRSRTERLIGVLLTAWHL